MEMDLAAAKTEDKTAEEKKNEETIEVDPELEAMYKAGVHYGYSRGSRHPRMAPFIFGFRNNVEIIDLEKTREKLEQAVNFIKKLGKENKQILYVGTKPPIRSLIEKYAKEAGMPYFTNRWIGGFLTNFGTLRGRIDYFEDIKAKKESSEYGKISKKEKIKIEKEFYKLERNFSGVLNLKTLPSALLIIDPKEESTAVREAKRKNIPVIAVANTDANPEDASYIIPGNDASISSVEYFLNKLTKAYLSEKGKTAK